MAHLTLNLTGPSGPTDAEVLVLGHSLGTSSALWHDAAALLRETYRVVSWELPGHGGAAPATEPFRVADLTDTLIADLTALGVERFHYAGVSIGGCVGLDLAVRHADRVVDAAIISAGARVDAPDFWRQRAATVRAEGIGTLVEPSRGRWFAETTPPRTVEAVLDLLRATDAESYALAAEALAAFDVWDALPGITTRLLAVAGQNDEAVPVDRSELVATSVPRGSLAIIPDAAHSLAAEQPARLVAELTAFFAAA